MTFTLSDILSSTRGDPALEPENYPAVFEELIRLRDALFEARDRALAGKLPDAADSPLESSTATADGLYDTIEGLAKAIPHMIAERKARTGGK